MSVELEYMGDLATGDILVVDPGSETATLNGDDVSDQISGFEKIFELLVGNNTITYEDTEGSRNLAVTIAHTPRWL
jgi:phage-related protein